MCINVDTSQRYKCPFSLLPFGYLSRHQSARCLHLICEHAPLRLCVCQIKQNHNRGNNAKRKKKEKKELGGVQKLKLLQMSDQYDEVPSSQIIWFFLAVKNAAPSPKKSNTKSAQRHFFKWQLETEKIINCCSLLGDLLSFISQPVKPATPHVSGC